MTSSTADSRVTGSLRSVDGAGVLRLEGRIESRPDDVWSALTEPARLLEWLGEVEGELRVGGEFHAHFSATGWDGTCRVDACEPPRRLLIATKSDGEPDCEIEVILAAEGGETLVVVEDRGLPLEQLAAYGAGDQVLVEDLVAHLAGRGRCDARARWRELQPGYRELAAAVR